MPSKVKILPSDVVLMIIDYLDSPSMMNCRQVCRSWLDVIEGNRSLWNHFEVVNYGQTVIPMLEMFASKSNNTIRVFSLHQKEKPSTPLDQAEAELQGKAIVELLLRSKISFKSWQSTLHGWASIWPSFLSSCLSEFKNLKVFSEDSFFGDRQVVDWSIRRESAAASSNNQFNEKAISGRYLTSLKRTMAFTAVPQIKASYFTLQRLTCSCEILLQEDFILPNLLFLELTDVVDSLPEAKHYPRLKSLLIYLGESKKKFTFPSNLPSSLVGIYLSAPGTGRGRAFTRKALDVFKKSYTELHTLLIDSAVDCYTDELIKVIKARIAAQRKGLKVDGIAMKPIQELVIGLAKFDKSSLVKLRVVVPKVGNSGE